MIYILLDNLTHDIKKIGRHEWNYTVAAVNIDGGKKQQTFLHLVAILCIYLFAREVTPKE